VSAEWRSWPAEGNSALTDRNDEAVNGQGRVRGITRLMSIFGHGKASRAKTKHTEIRRAEVGRRK
jgi:hypothetical protein